MALTEPARHRLHRRLEEILGSDEANTLMHHLPPSNWADLATTDDLAHLETTLGTRVDLTESRLERRIDLTESRLERRIDTLDHKIDAVDHKLDSKIDGLEHRLRTEMADMRTEMADMRTDFHTTMRTNAYLTLGGVSAIVTALVAATNLT